MSSLLKNKFFNSVFKIASGTAVSQLILAISIPIIARLYLPEQIGILSVYLSFFNFWIAVVTWRYENALFLAKTKSESIHIFRVGMICCLVTSAFTFPILKLLIDYETLGFQVVPSWSTYFSTISLFFFGLFVLYRAWLVRLANWRAVNISLISKSLSNVSLKILSGFVSPTVIGLFIAELASCIFAWWTSRSRVMQFTRLVSTRWNRKRMKAIAVKHKKFALYETPSTALNQLATTLPVPMIGSLYGAEAAGLFAMARLLCAIPISQLGKAIGDVFQQELSGLIRQKELIRGKRLFYRLSLYLSGIGLFILLITLLFAEPLVNLIFGSSWQGMGKIIVHISPWMFMVLVVSSLSRALSLLNRQELKLIYDVVSLAVVLTSYYLANDIGSNIIEFINMLTVGLSVSYVIYYLIIVYSFHSKAKLSN
ncbi:oligosaccharide flippase family protein [uncultured Idiomarina sp.]|uniref:lipopolysaccharide biosynthesis protein n=1 Tax=uncultured Idiomarina sp. TaxID=352961 RepID=UPI0032B176AC|tara:strand:- start:824 stop:2101 length:1278 start_codon:yes stop_codon:yes gene_type:complete